MYNGEDVSIKPRIPREVTVVFVRQGEDERHFDRAFWRRIGPQARIAAMWEMVLEVETLKGGNDGQHRLQRSVLRVQHR
jgi:hypothetical protein